MNCFKRIKMKKYDERIRKAVSEIAKNWEEYLKSKKAAEKAAEIRAEKKKKELSPDKDIKYSLREKSLEPKKPPVSDSGVKYSLNVDVKNYSSWEKKNAELKSFSAAVLELMAKKNMKPSQFYRKAHIDRKLFSKLKTDYCYKPNKITALKICFGLDLTLAEAKILLQKAGYSLSRCDSFDLAIRYCFDNGITDLDIVNEILLQLDEKTL